MREMDRHPAKGDGPERTLSPERRGRRVRRSRTRHCHGAPVVRVGLEAGKTQPPRQAFGVLITPEWIDMQQPSQGLTGLRRAPEADPFLELIEERRR